MTDYLKRVIKCLADNGFSLAEIKELENIHHINVTELAQFLLEEYQMASRETG